MKAVAEGGKKLIRPKVILFGASGGGLEALELLQRHYDIVAFTDNNKSVHGTRVRGVPVIPPETLSAQAFDRIVIASVWSESIVSQLLGMGIAPHRLAMMGEPSPPMGTHSTIGAGDEDFGFVEIWDKCAPHTTISFDHGMALYRAVRHLLRTGVKGSIVEHGAGDGGAAMIAMHTLLQLGVNDRHFVLFDSFASGEGETTTSAPNDDAHLLSIDTRRPSLERTKHNLSATGYDMRYVAIVDGASQAFLKGIHTGPIAMLRLATRFCQSTLAGLEALYPRLGRGGLLDLDGYGYWHGARMAVEQYFTTHKERIARPMLQRIDTAGRLGVRPDTPVPEKLERHDYRPEGLADPQLLPSFPTLSPVDPDTMTWPYLRRTAPHILRVDARNEHDVPTGVQSVEEALLLHNNALAFRGKRGLEIGSHLAWSTAHILAAGLELDVIEPALHRPDQRAAIESSLGTVKAGRYHLWAGFSPSIVAPVAGVRPQPWSFVFIDGNHDGEAPRMDAEAVVPFCAEDCCIMFHDMTSPDVAKGLAVLKALGWDTGIYNTMQIMGIAWRGEVTPVRHVMDPAMPMPEESFLKEFTLLSV